MDLNVFAGFDPGSIFEIMRADLQLDVGIGVVEGVKRAPLTGQPRPNLKMRAPLHDRVGMGIGSGSRPVRVRGAAAVLVRRLGLSHLEEREKSGDKNRSEPAVAVHSLGSYLFTG